MTLNFELRDQANDHYLFTCKKQTNLQILASQGFIKEIGDTVFLWNQEISLWEGFDSPHLFLNIPDYPRYERLWVALRVKQGLFSKKKKGSSLLPLNKIQVTTEEMIDLIDIIKRDHLSYKETYELYHSYFPHTPEYREPKPLKK